jgi:hypothetical protein
LNSDRQLLAVLDIGHQSMKLVMFTALALLGAKSPILGIERFPENSF